ncbi:MAG: alpha/beta hydrolase family protein [Clostridia bacterium]|nr:alpha/beta hydrolase family protein [Deltaproteobacteria bacterium]
MTWTHPLDYGIAALLRGQRMFGQGWGDEGLLARLENQPLFDQKPPQIDVQWMRSEALSTKRGPALTRDGVFVSPLTDLPEAVVQAHVRLLSQPGNTRVALILAGSREEGFRLRESIYRRLVFRGIDVALLENPFYGLRRPPEQRGALLRTVSEHVLLNLAMIEEARGLVGWFERQGYERICVAGYSMGGFMAGLVAASLDKPIAVAACAAGASPTPTFTTQILSWSVNYTTLGGKSAAARIGQIFDRANLKHYPVPVAPQAAVILGCSHDGYVPKSETEALHAHWPGSELRWVHSGHIAALFTERRALRGAVFDALDRLEANRAL